MKKLYILLMISVATSSLGAKEFGDWIDQAEDEVVAEERVVKDDILSSYLLVKKHIDDVINDLFGQDKKNIITIRNAAKVQHKAAKKLLKISQDYDKLNKKIKNSPTLSKDKELKKIQDDTKDKIKDAFKKVNKKAKEIKNIAKKVKDKKNKVAKKVITQKKKVIKETEKEEK